MVEYKGTAREIQIALSRSQIVIDPQPAVEAYSSTSVDLTLDPHITEFRDDLSDDPVETVIDPSHKNFVAERTLTRITRQVIIDQSGYLLIPDKLVLGWTVERLELPIYSRLAARVEGKSSLARLGLGVHMRRSRRQPRLELHGKPRPCEPMLPAATPNVSEPTVRAAENRDIIVE